ncbi:hypothetical protein LTR08_002939 [Meristemomyces frigidus]|nr:hypothetical protein LTR08_002939 [Meristemomyces frigidus]
MRDTLAWKLHSRELADPAVRSGSSPSRSTPFRRVESPSATVLAPTYGDRRLIAELDIVNELDGHSGCVNALSWSKSGKLLASGSDDQHLNIHTYQPSTGSNNQFQLTTTVATGHKQNIFSVKFMPHHNDRTVITCAGDGEVRIFDLEYAGQTRDASAASSLASASRQRGSHTLYNGVRYLGDGDTDCRVYRSHGDRVKRIVTESSPHLFLTCSEDGEVRQWDLRQPSSAYPPPRNGRYGSGSDVPPPLISYKRYNLDLNTISCSASQPHYIALGGAHIHAFLHDRRMTGRDRLREAGRLLSPSGGRTSDEDEMMSQATQCVRKFAPRGQQTMKRTENGHITACKISDARPDEMIVSWSGDHIYSFDLVRSPDAREEESNPSPSKSTESKDRKRKRKGFGSQTSLGQDDTARASARPRARSRGDVGEDVVARNGQSENNQIPTEVQREHGAALRVRYLNGQSEDIPIFPPTQREHVHQTTREREAHRLARSSVLVRSKLFSAQSDSGRVAFSTVLGEAASHITAVDDAMREWRYPMNPNPETVVAEQTLRRHRESARRFFQAAGTLARVLGGKFDTGPMDSRALMAYFHSVEVRGNELQPTQREQFGYDFLKAILLWLESGIGCLIDGFTMPEEMSATARAAGRLPIPEAEASTEAVDDLLIPYLLRLASDRPIVDFEVNRFEVDENRHVFATERAAVLAFAAALRLPFTDLSSAVAVGEGDERAQSQDRNTATRFWALKVARGVLLNAADGVTSAFVDRAFGGSGEEDGDADTGGTTVDEAVAAVQRAAEFVEGGGHFRDDNDDDDDDDDNETENEETENEETENEDTYDIFTAVNQPRDQRVQASVPCTPYTRKYTGHCNVRTVKDVNYFGLDDEYVVSGSDDGNFFIWDRKSEELVNVLEGDGEVVNVIQGHPYEPMLAVSGIDHTIKIFSPDARAREQARLERSVRASDARSFSSIAWPHRREQRARRASRGEDSSPPVTSEPLPAVRVTPEQRVADDDDFVAPTGLASRKRMRDAQRIVERNAAERGGGGDDEGVMGSYLTVRDLHPLLLMLARSGRLEL